MQRGSPERPPETPLEAETVFREFLIATVLNSQAAADRLDLRLAEMLAFNLLEVAGPLTAGDLAARLGVPTATTTRIIDRLERTGYVRRERDPHDRRKVLVDVVPEQVPRVQAVLEPTRRHLAAHMGDHDPGELPRLFEVFAHITRAFQAATAEMRLPRGPG